MRWRRLIVFSLLLLPIFRASADAPDLVASAAGEVAAPGLPVAIRIFYSNLAEVPANGAVITVESVAGFGSLPANCSVTGSEARCRIERVPAGPPTSHTLDLEVLAPDASDVAFDIVIRIEADEGDANPGNDRFTATLRTYRTFFVTNADDRGSGSLRAAIEESNASCYNDARGLIAFRIPPGGGAWHTIRPESPLPVAGALRLVIDGFTQSGYFGDSNPAGPEIEVSGELQGEGDGLTIASHCGSTIRGLSINSFPRLGVLLATAACPIEGVIVTRVLQDNFIGTDPTGGVARPNLMGVYAGGTGGWSIASNVVSGNVRSGLFIESGINELRANTVGLNAGRTGALANGGCGIWVDARASGTNILDNMIGFNHYAGVGIDSEAWAVSVYGNSIQANHHLAIDWGLDGAPSGPIAIPVIASVRVESSRTIVEGWTGAAGGTFDPVVQVYATDAADPSGFGEGQFFLGSVRSDEGSFRFEFAGDLTGKWISATNTREDYNGFAKPPHAVPHVDTGWGFLTTTSELSRAVEVR